MARAHGKDADPPADLTATVQGTMTLRAVVGGEVLTWDFEPEGTTGQDAFSYKGKGILWRGAYIQFKK